MVLYQINPVNRGILLLVLFGCWALLSHFTATKEEQEEEVVVGRHLMTVPEVVEEDGLTERPEMATKIEILPANVSQEECVEPAVKQFPSPILGRSARRHGGLVLHILIACYMFIGLAIVCDEYFVPALERMSDVLGLSPDVAGWYLLIIYNPAGVSLS